MGKIEDAEATMRANLEKNTGKSFEAWMAMARRKNFAKHGQIVTWLKTEHELGHGFANMIALRSRESAENPPGRQLVCRSRINNIMWMLEKAIG